MAKYDLWLAEPIMNAAGMLGFAPDARRVESLGSLGAFITNPVSLQARNPAHGERLVEYPGGFLLHSGHPNPGLKSVIRRYAGQWAASELPVIVHLLVQSADQAAQMAAWLEGIEGVSGLELGLPPQINEEQAVSVVQAASGELPLIVRLPFEQAQLLGKALSKSTASAFSLAPPRGTLSGAGSDLCSGRLYGPAVLPLALRLVRELARLETPIYAAGGVYRQEDVQAMLAAGASAVQLDAVLWRGGLEQGINARSRS